jgi:hypothetical protein
MCWPRPASGSADRFRFDLVDVGGPWCPAKMGAESWATVLGKLRDFETMKVSAAFFSGGYPGKDYSNVSDCLGNTIMSRLEEIEQDDAADNIAALRLGGKLRLWGVRKGNEFSILWWDPDHGIWPSTLRNT